MRAYERLEAWRRCHELALAVYRATEGFPKSELYGLTSQSRRAAVSAATNIAEGSAKRGPSEFARFLDIAVGSLNELAYLLHLERDLGMLDQPGYVRLESVRAAAGAVTWRLYQAIRRASIGKRKRTA
jgi:four helix bundle protein